MATGILLPLAIPFFPRTRKHLNSVLAIRIVAPRGEVRLARSSCNAPQDCPAGQYARGRQLRQLSKVGVSGARAGPAVERGNSPKWEFCRDRPSRALPRRHPHRMWCKHMQPWM
jgi:hypothetical protein